VSRHELYLKLQTEYKISVKAEKELSEKYSKLKSKYSSFEEELSSMTSKYKKSQKEVKEIELKWSTKLEREIKAIHTEYKVKLDEMYRLRAENKELTVANRNYIKQIEELA
jgi:chromosome segregation ATPase